MSKHPTQEISLFDGGILAHAAVQAVFKLNPRGLMRNPVIFVTAMTSVLVSILVLRDAAIGSPELAIGVQVTIWLWFTVLFANSAEAIAEGRGKARADAFRATRSTTRAKVLADPRRRDIFHPKDAAELEEGDVILVETGDILPTDGEVIEGVASVDESAITGRVGAGDPRVRWRPLLGYRGHAAGVGLVGGQGHRRARQHLSRQDDRAGGRGQTAKNPQ